VLRNLVLKHKHVFARWWLFVFKPFLLKAMPVLFNSRVLLYSVTFNYIEHNNVEKAIKDSNYETLSEHFV